MGGIYSGDRCSSSGTGIQFGESESFKRSGKYTEKEEEETIKLCPKRKATVERSNMTLIYRTQTTATNRIEIVSENDIEECLGITMNVGTFVSRRFKYDTSG